MSTKETQQLRDLLTLIDIQSKELTLAEKTKDEANALFEKARHTRYKTHQEYHKLRRNHIQVLLERYEKALCTYCKQLRPMGRMHTSREFGFYWDSDCRYNRWRTPYDRRFSICERCIPTQAYTTREEDGYSVGKELLEFDQEAYLRWLTYGSENLEIAAKALNLPSPVID